MKIYAEGEILYLKPEVDLVASRIEDIRSAFNTGINEHPDAKAVVLDVTGVDVVDSLGVNLIIGLYKHVSAKSKSFKITNVDDKVMKVANFFKFSSIFPVEKR